LQRTYIRLPDFVDGATAFGVGFLPPFFGAITAVAFLRFFAAASFAVSTFVFFTLGAVSVKVRESQVSKEMDTNAVLFSPCMLFQAAMPCKVEMTWSEMWLTQNGCALCPQPWLFKMSQNTFKASGHNRGGGALCQHK